LYARPRGGACNSRSSKVSSQLKHYVSCSWCDRRYPAQESIGGDSKIPSTLYYDPQGHVRAVGAETLQPHVIEQAEEEGWVKLAWYVYRRGKNMLYTINLGQVETSSSRQASAIVSHTGRRYRTSPTRQIRSRSPRRLHALPLPMRSNLYSGITSEFLEIGRELY
jgi:hypothetical protein